MCSSDLGEDELRHVSRSINRSIGEASCSFEGRVSLNALLSEEDWDFYPDDSSPSPQEVCVERFDILSPRSSSGHRHDTERALSWLAELGCAS